MAENTNTSRRIGERIKAARKAKEMTQNNLSEKLDVTFQAVSSWERGEFIPDSDHLPALAKELDLSLDALFAEKDPEWKLKPVNFDAEHMRTFVKGRAQMLKLTQTLKVLELLPEAHSDQTRKSKYGFEAPYVVHPLTLACHALAMGLRDDDILAACLAHDIVEDSKDPHYEPENLPVNETVREAVRLVTKPAEEEKQKDKDWEKKYYANIRKNPLACLVKCLDRVNNLSGMADGFPRKKMKCRNGTTPGGCCATR